MKRRRRRTGLTDILLLIKTAPTHFGRTDDGGKICSQLSLSLPPSLRIMDAEIFVSPLRLQYAPVYVIQRQGGQGTIFSLSNFYTYISWGRVLHKEASLALL